MCVAFVFTVAQVNFDFILKYFGFTSQNKELDVDEDLPNFFETLTIAEANKVEKANQQMKMRFGFEF